MKRGSSIGAPHVVQIAMGCDGQPILPFLREELEGEPKYRRHIERAGRSGPRCGGCRTWGQAAPVAERGNLKAPEVTQLNCRLTTKLHKEKVCNAPRLPGAMRSRGRKRWRYRKEPPCAGGSLAVCLGSGQKRRLANFSPHCLSRGHRMRTDRQLQHRRALAFAQAREQHERTPCHPFRNPPARFRSADAPRQPPPHFPKRSKCASHSRCPTGIPKAWHRPLCAATRARRTTHPSDTLAAGVR